jgi:adsorption protein B
MNPTDAFVAACLAPLAIAALASGLDDFVLDASMAWSWFRRRSGKPRPPGSELCGVPQKRIAIFLPLWQEHAVVGRMLEHNIGTIRYTDYDFFVGAYANDPLTLDAVRAAEARYPNVHLAIVPHDGPTSKADCLNWVFQGMLAHEEACGVRFELVVTHDAEDVIHPESLHWINYYSADYDMVQIPVLPLATPFGRFTHGVYCDEFSEFQTKDVPVRQTLGGFVPSNGVGTGYTRRALDKLAQSASNQVFDPTCLTEDYDCGFRLHRLGFRQVFVPIRFLDGEPLATREYFPGTFRQAVRQRTRWVIGISLQGWERHGWSGGLAAIYWFWRDRKGLVGNPLSLFGNLLCLYGLLTWLWSSVSGQPWGLRELSLSPIARRLLAATLAFQAFRMLVRAGCSARIYGWAFAAGAPLRVIWANWMNAIATSVAILRYARTRLLRQPQVWLKTEHTYPALGALGRLPAHALQAVDPAAVRRQTARALPQHVVRGWKVLPFKVAEGRMFLATPAAPPEALKQELRRYTRLEVRFQLVSHANFEQLLSQLL